MYHLQQGICSICSHTLIQEARCITCSKGFAQYVAILLSRKLDVSLAARDFLLHAYFVIIRLFVADEACGTKYICICWSLFCKTLFEDICFAKRYLRTSIIVLLTQ